MQVHRSTVGVKFDIRTSSLLSFNCKMKTTFLANGYTTLDHMVMNRYRKDEETGLHFVAHDPYTWSIITATMLFETNLAYC